MLWVAIALTVVHAIVLLTVPKETLAVLSGIWIFLMAPAVTIFPILYAFFYRWYRDPIGRALMLKAVGLGLLVDISMIYAMFGDDYFLREQVKFTVFTLLLVGMWYQLAVFLGIKVKSAKRRKQQRRHDQVETSNPMEGRERVEQDSLD